MITASVSHEDAIAQLLAEMAVMKEQSSKIQAEADRQGRNLTAEEMDTVESLFARFDATEQEIARREKIAAMENSLSASAGKKVSPNPLPRVGIDDANGRPVRVEVSAPLIANDPKFGFRSFGDFALKVKSAARPAGAVTDPNLLICNAALGTAGNTDSGEDGGFAVPPQFMTEVMQKVLDEAPMLPLTDQMFTTSNRLVFPTDETTPWQSTGGIQAFWDDELEEMVASKPKLSRTEVYLDRLTALVRVSDELMSDAPMMDSYLRRKAPSKIAYRVARAIIAGSGSGQPLGILNSKAKVAVPAEAGPQTADTIVYANIVKMWARLPAPSMSRAVWLANQDILPQLLTLAFPTSTATPVPMFIPPGGLPNTPSGSLLGRPIIFTEACNTLGDEGDLILADLSQYLTGMKVGGIRADTSMHLYFDYGAMAYRFVMRLGGQPWWAAPVTKAQGGSSATLSPFVTLANR